LKRRGMRRFVSDVHGTLAWMGREVPDRLLGCPTCGSALAWVDELLTLKPHGVSGTFEMGQECPATGTEGVDLGPRDEYAFKSGDLVYLGHGGGPKMPLLCPRCRRNVSVNLPPDGAFHRRLTVYVECPDAYCGSRVALEDLREGPQGTMVAR
jgi:hypothetical protein